MLPRRAFFTGYPIPMNGLLGSTALTLSFCLTMAGPAVGQTVEFDIANPNDNWNLIDDNWLDINGDPIVYQDGFDTIFGSDIAPYSVDIVEDVAPGSVLFVPDLTNERSLTGTAGTLSTATVPLRFSVQGGTVNLEADVIGPNAIIFNDGATGTVNLNSTVAPDAQVIGGTLTNQAGGDLQGSTVIAGTGVVDAAGGSFATVDVQTGGTLNVTAMTDADVTVSGGQNNIDAALTGTLGVSSGVADVTASVSETTTITGGTLNNTGALAGIALRGGVLNHNVGGDVLGPVTLSDDGTLQLNGGNFASLGLNGGTLNINTAVSRHFVNNGTEVQINPLVGGIDPVPGQTGSVTGTIDNITGTLRTFAGANVTGLVTNRTGAVIESEGGTYNSGLLVVGGTATVNGATVIGPTGALTNDAGMVTLNNTLAGNLANTGVGVTTNNARLDGNLSVSAGRFVQNGSVTAAGVSGNVTVSGGTLEAAGGTFDQTITAAGGDVRVTGVTVADITNTGAGDVTITDSGTMTGDLRHATATGEFNVDGRLNGGLTVLDGVGTIRGTIVQSVTLDGGITRMGLSTAQIAGPTVVNAATLNANAGTFVGDVQLNTGANMNVRGFVAGDIVNTDGTLIVTPDGGLTGAIRQTDGATILRGALDGEATVGGGTFETQSESTITQTLTVDEGVFTANGGSITGGLNITGGTADLNGTIATNVTTTGGETSHGGVLNGRAAVDGGTFVSDAGSSITQDMIVDGGVFTGNGGSIAGGLRILDGTADITGPLTTDITTLGGTTTNTGTLTGDVTATGGAFTNDGQIIGALDVNGGAFTQTGGDVAGQTTLSAGVLTASGGDFRGGITNDGAELRVTGAVTADVTHATGQLVIGSTGALDGDVSNAASMRLSGDLTGALVNTGSVDARGTITGAVTNAAGRFTVLDGQSTAVTDGLTNAETARLTLEGTLAANVANLQGGVFSLNGGMLAGAARNFGDLQTTGTATITGTTRNENTLDVQTGRLTIQQALTNSAGSTLRIAQNATLAADMAMNEAAALIVNDGTLTGAVDNQGLIETTNGVFDGGLVINQGQIGGTAVGALRFAGGLNNRGTVDLGGNSTPGDRVFVSGAGLSGDGRFALDIDLRDDIGGSSNSDSITVTNDAAVTGNVELAFNVLGIGGQQGQDIPVLNVDESLANQFNVTATGLPDPGEAVVYALLQENANSDVFVVDLLNPGIGALAGSIVLTQSLIGSVINRPSSPFVTGLAFEDENPCGAGGWARLTGGSAESNGLITQTGADARAVLGEIAADFYGLQMGGDFGCFNGFYNGWNLATGGILGFNEGVTTQPVFALTEAAGLSDRITSITDVDFIQSYAGVYGTAVRDRFSTELQYRVEQTNFTANNVGVNGSIGLGLDDSKFESTSSTLSGSLSYALNIPETELVFVPVAGFAYTQVSTDPIRFENGNTVQVEDFDSRIGFVGGTISSTKLGEDGTSALSEFITATYYKDFADDPESVFTSGDGLQTRAVTTENLGAYAEVSFGVNYTKILEIGNKLNAKQFSANARADWRVSDQLESWGITAQMRLQF